MSENLFDCKNPMMGDSMFDIFQQIDSTVCIKLNGIASLHASGETFDLIMMFVAIEIMIALIYMLIDSGPGAIARGVEMLVIAAFVAGITQPAVWSTVVIPLVREVTSHLVKPIADPSELKSQAMSAYAGAIRTVASPSNMTTSRNQTADVIVQQNASMNAAKSTYTEARNAATTAYNENLKNMSAVEANKIYKKAIIIAKSVCQQSGGGDSCL